MVCYMVPIKLTAPHLVIGTLAPGTEAVKSLVGTAGDVIIQLTGDIRDTVHQKEHRPLLVLTCFIIPTFTHKVVDLLGYPVPETT